MRCAGAVGSHRRAGGPAKRGIDPCLRALGKSRAAGGSLSGSVSASLRVAARVSSTDSASIREERAAVSDSRERERQKKSGQTWPCRGRPSGLTCAKSAARVYVDNYVDNGRFAGHCAGCAKQLNGGEPAASLGSGTGRSRRPSGSEWVRGTKCSPYSSSPSAVCNQCI
jgi:hypothetical protein